MSYEHCDKHDAPATNGCEECGAERRERTLLNLDNFLASWFGGTGERHDTQRFLEAFGKEGLAVHDDDGANVTMDTLKRNEETMGAQLTDARAEVQRLQDQIASPEKEWFARGFTAGEKSGVRAGLFFGVIFGGLLLTWWLW